jgi:hypothetical protein
MSDTTDYDTTQAMLVYGGSFCVALARCYRVADPENRARLRYAFPELWRQYGELARVKALAETMQG